MNPAEYLDRMAANNQTQNLYQKLRLLWSPSMVYMTPFNGGTRMGLHITVRIHPSYTRPLLRQKYQLSFDTTIIMPVFMLDDSEEMRVAQRMGIVDDLCLFKQVATAGDVINKIDEEYYNLVRELDDPEAQKQAGEDYLCAVTRRDSQL